MYASNPQSLGARPTPAHPTHAANVILTPWQLCSPSKQPFHANSKGLPTVEVVLLAAHAADAALVAVELALGNVVIEEVTLEACVAPERNAALAACARRGLLRVAQLRKGPAEVVMVGVAQSLLIG